MNETTILVSINGTIGNIGTYNGEKVVLGKSACYFNISSLLHKVYFCYLLESDYFLKYALNSATGSTIKNVPLKAINDFFVPLPPLAEQERIVCEIKRWFALIDQIEQGKVDLRATIKQAKSKILDLAIHGKLVPQHPNDEPASELLKHINPAAEITCDNGQYGKMPSGWCMCHINDIAESLLGKTLDKSKDTGKTKAYLCALNVKWFSFDFTTQKKFLIEPKDFERYAVVKGDLMVCEGGDVGRAAIWTYDKEMYYQNALHRIRTNEAITNKYLLYLLYYFKGNGTIDYLCKGVTIKHFTQETMNKLDIPLPPIAEQHRIVTKIKELFSRLDTIQNQLEI